MRTVNEHPSFSGSWAVVAAEKHFLSVKMPPSFPVICDGVQQPSVEQVPTYWEY